MTRFLAAIPVHNEESHIEAVLSETLKYAKDILAVDDGSTDGTFGKLGLFPNVQVARHPRNLGYGGALVTAFRYAIEHQFEVLVTLDCDGQHEPKRIGELVDALIQSGADIISGSRYLKVFDERQIPPEERRKINVEVTRWLNEHLGFGLTDAFCGFKAYRVSTLKSFDITDFGYAMPLQVWVQAYKQGLKVVEAPVPLIYLDEKRAFGGALDNSDYRLRHYRSVFDAEMTRQGLGAFAAPEPNRS